MIKSHEIDKSTVKFLMGFSGEEQLLRWFHENPEAITLTFAGRSNVGKSTLINALYGKSVSKTSKTPGRTREINLFSFGLKTSEDEQSPTYYFFDLPGYGHAEVSKQQKKQWNALLAIFFEHLGPRDLIITIQDSRHPNQKSDQQFLQFLKSYKIPSILVFNKEDKLKKQSDRAALKKMIQQMSSDYKMMKHVFTVSAEKKKNLDPLLLVLQTFLLSKSQVS